MRRGLVRGALGAGLLLVVTACGGDGESVSGRDADPGSPTTTTVDSTTVAPIDEIFTGDPDSALCQLAREGRSRPVLDPFQTDLPPTEVKLRMLALEQRFSELADAAPAELSADLDRVERSLIALGDVLRDAGYDFAALADSEADLEPFDDPDFARVALRLAEYQRQVCGLEPEV